MPRPRRADARDNDDRILRAAARVLAEDPGATIQRIADEAGLVRLTVYRHYPDRHALRRAVFEAAAEEATRVVEETRDRDPVEALRALVVAMASIVHRYPLLAVGADLQPAPGVSRAPVPPPRARAMQRAVLDLVRRGQEQGRLRPDLPGPLFAQAVVGVLRTTLRFAGPAADPAAVGGSVADLLLDGMVVRG